MNDLKTLFSKLLKRKESRYEPHEMPGKSLKFPPEFRSKYDIFQYLNFSIPELQPIKLSLEFGKEEKAFEQFFKYLKMRPPASFLVNWWKRDEIVQTLKTQYPETIPGLLQAADDILDHKFLLFSLHAVQAETPILWNKSYEHLSKDGKFWTPGEKYTYAALCADEEADIHFVWQLSRHQHFLDLGKAYWYTRDQVYIQEFVDEILSWIEQNPYLLSVNWVYEYEIALRGIFWLFGYAFFFSSELLDEPFFCRFYHSLLSHGHAIYDALCATSSSHLPLKSIVAQASFLYLLSTAFPEYVHSKIWGKCGWDILQWKTPLLSLETILQSSPAVLTTLIEFYCLVLSGRQNNRFHIPQTVLNGFTTMVEHWSLFLKPNGCLCGFGEDFPEHLFTGTYRQPQTFRYLFSIAALLLKYEKFFVHGQHFDETLLWYFGLDGQEEFQRLMTTGGVRQQSCLIPHSSYAMLQSEKPEGNGYCVVSTGLNVFSTSLQLKHSDLLSFELFANGQEYLIDGGAYSFQHTHEWNQYFRSIQAHNTITVDRITHINFSERRVQSTFDQWLSTSTFDFLSGHHNGFEDLDEPITHYRSIFYYKPTYWILCDLLLGGGQHFFDQYFHFPPFRLNVDFSNKCVDIRTSEHRRFTLMPFHPQEMDVSIFTGGETADSGWISQGYKDAVAASFIKYGKCTIAPASFHTLMYAYYGEEVLRVSGRYLQAYCEEKLLLCHEISALEISFEQETHYFAFLYEPSKYPVVEIEPQITFSGTLMFLRKQKEHIRELILYNATVLTINDRLLFASDTPVESITLQFEGKALHVICSDNYIFRTQAAEITEVFVNNRPIRIKHEHDSLLISTTRI
ncbi:heparinase II/III family protein [Candidatus Vecturithrix granuli]|uniref:Heparinase II/III family protein n=1 Tax=Vecturithrix granuli TaxID=1499967 RepID=A0A081C388_VECG1|nr:heparinase II/III family protein [Candidatus Vecturithrix granuli]